LLFFHPDPSTFGRLRCAASARANGFNFGVGQISLASVTWRVVRAKSERHPSRRERRLQGYWHPFNRSPSRGRRAGMSI